MSIYEEKLTVTLTIAEWLEVNMALFDAQHYNEEHDYPTYAASIRRLRTKVEDQTGDKINAADKEVIDHLYLNT